MSIARTTASNVNQFMSKDTQGFISPSNFKEFLYNISESYWHSNSFNKRKHTGLIYIKDNNKFSMLLILE